MWCTCHSKYICCIFLHITVFSSPLLLDLYIWFLTHTKKYIWNISDHEGELFKLILIFGRIWWFSSLRMVTLLWYSTDFMSSIKYFAQRSTQGILVFKPVRIHGSILLFTSTYDYKYGFCVRILFQCKTHLIWSLQGAIRSGNISFPGNSTFTVSPMAAQRSIPKTITMQF